MGKYNSSKYRVVPLVNAIKQNQTNFNIFIQSVNSETAIPYLLCPKDDNAYFFGVNEKKLNPTKAHLTSLIEYVFNKKFEQMMVTDQKRLELYGFSSDESRVKARNEALLLLDEKYSNVLPLPKEWYIFEGPTCPDIYIEGNDYVIICEGKWTESHITIKTTHLNLDCEYRNQMIRHIQGALNVTNKKIYAFYIVDENCGYISDLTKDSFRQQLESETIYPKEFDEILSSFYGYTTWGQLESLISSLHFLTKDEIDLLDYFE